VRARQRREYEGPVAPRVACVLATVVVCAAAPAATLAAPADVGVTRGYIQANYEMVQFSAARHETGQALLEGVLYKTKSLCPTAAAGSPKYPESTQLSNEVIGGNGARRVPCHPARDQLVPARRRTLPLVQRR